MTKAELEAKLKSVSRSQKIFQGKYYRLLEAYDELKSDAERLSEIVSVEERRHKFAEMARTYAQKIAGADDDDEQRVEKLVAAVKKYKAEIEALKRDLAKHEKLESFEGKKIA